MAPGCLHRFYTARVGWNRWRSRAVARSADEVIVRVYRRLLGFVGGIGLFFFFLQVLPPVVGARLLASLPMAAFGVVCLWARQALSDPRPLTYWATVSGFGGVVASIVVTSILTGDILTTLFTAFVWAGPLRALGYPP